MKRAIIITALVTASLISGTFAYADSTWYRLNLENKSSIPIQVNFDEDDCMWFSADSKTISPKTTDIFQFHVKSSGFSCFASESVSEYTIKYMGDTSSLPIAPPFLEFLAQDGSTREFRFKSANRVTETYCFPTTSVGTGSPKILACTLSLG